MIEIEIDGKKLQVDEGASIIEAADAAGIYIPRFCYHKKLSVAANCRMCLVDVEKVGKPLPACATPVTPEMKVFTRSKKAMDAQRAVMEFLLINHPLDCPICDQGGECELQDLAMGYGAADSVYDERKRAVFSEDIGSLIGTEMTRCIHCTRCVRFGEEIANLPELGVVNRGEHAEIGTYVKHMMQSELSGNVIDLCPVGALTAKPSRYSVRGWEAIEHPMIAPHDCVGTNIYVHTKGREYFKERLVMRVVPRENESINETWMSDRDRFSYEGVNHPERCLQPMIKRNDQWVEMSWDEIIHDVAMRANAVIQEYSPEQIAAVVSPSSTIEECFLMQGWLRALGSNNVDYRLRQSDFSDQDLMTEFPTQGLPIADIENLNAILLVGSNIRFEQPMIGHRINKAAAKGADIFVINPVDYTFTFRMAEKIITVDIITALSELIKALEGNKSAREAERMATALKTADQGAVFLGTFSLNHPHAAYIRAQVHKISQLAGVKTGVFTEGANAAGAYLAGAVPHRGPAGAAVVGPSGLTAKEVFVDKPVHAYFLLGFEPEHDVAFPNSAIESLRAADLSVCLTPYVTNAMKQYANVILPTAPFTENEGTFVNAAGTWQSFDAASPIKEKVKPAWKIVRALARAMQMTGFDYKVVTDIRDELKDKVHSMTVEPSKSISLDQVPHVDKGLLRMGAYSIYGGDSIVRRAKSLQEAMSDRVVSIGLNAKEANALGLNLGDRVTATQSGTRVTLPLMIDNRLADGVVSIPMGCPETAGFGEVMALVALQREAS